MSTTHSNFQILQLKFFAGVSLCRLVAIIDNFSLFPYSWSLFNYSFSFFPYRWSFSAYSGKVPLIRALRDCKQRSLSVSKKAPTVSKKNFPRRKQPKARFRLRAVPARAPLHEQPRACNPAQVVPSPAASYTGDMLSGQAFPASDLSHDMQP